MIRSAPVTFLVTLAVLSAAIWWLTNQLYAARFDGQKETISALEGRIKAKDDDLTRKSAQIAEFEKNATATLKQAIARDPNGIYQSGIKVGIAHGATRNLGVGLVDFILLDASGDFNPSLDFDYQDLALHIAGRPGTTTTSGGMGVVDRQRLGQVSCRIVSRRE